MTGSVPPPQHEAADLLVRRVLGGYFVVQAVVGGGFWALVASSPSVRSGFEMLAAEHAVTDSFVVADVVLGIVGSAVAAGLVLAGRPSAPAVCALVAGGIAYATLYILAWVVFTGSAGAMLGIMVPPAVLSCFCAHQVWRAWRRSTVASPAG